MTLNDVVALARAGFNVQQINAIISMMNQQPAQQPTGQQMQMPMQQPMGQQMQMPMQQPMGQQMQMPAQDDPVLTQLRVLTGAIQQNNINGTQQPAQRSADDIIASIINPKAEV